MLGNFFSLPNDTSPTLSYVLYTFKQIDSAAQKKDVPLCTLERYNSMMSVAVVSTTSAEASTDPNEQDAFLCTSFFQSFLKQAQMIVSSYYLN